MPTRQQKLSDIETKMNRWMARSMRASNAIRKLQKQRHRLLKEPVAKVDPMIEAKAELVQAIDDRLTQIIEGPAHDDLTIPPELNRADPLIAERMTAARKKAEAEARKAMPLSGKAALDYIKTPRKRKV